MPRRRRLEFADAGDKVHSIGAALQGLVNSTRRYVTAYRACQPYDAKEIVRDMEAWLEVLDVQLSKPIERR